MKTKRIITAVMATAFSIEAFTSSLLTSNINVANAVTSSDKASITSEDLYATSAFILNEGYSGIGSAKDLNGDGSIDVFDLVIARQQLAENDVISLTYFKADTYDIHINTEETVTFTVEVESPNTLPEKSLAVYDEDDNLIAYMNDNGEDGDYEADDGIYSAQADISNDICTLKDYYASTDKVKSNTFEISFYRNLTDEEKQTYIDTNNEIFALPYDEAIEYIKNSDDIETYIESVDGNSVLYIFSSGITAIKSKEVNFDVPVKSGQAPLNLKDYSESPQHSFVAFTLFGKSLFKDAQTALEKFEYTAPDEKKDVVVLRPFRNHNKLIDSENDEFTYFEYDDFEVAGNLIEAGLKENINCEAKVYDNEEVNIECWKDILSSNQYKVVLVDSHGDTFDAGFEFDYTSIGKDFTVELKEPINTILTGELFYVDAAYDDEFWEDIKAERVINNNGILQITGKFIDKYASTEGYASSNTPLDGSLWYLGSCYSAYINSENSSSLAYNLQKHGAEAVIGFNNKVSLTYCNKVLLDLVVNRMILNGDTVGDALADTQNEQGSPDPYIKDENTICILSGNKNMKLIEEKATLCGYVLEKDTKKPVFNLEKQDEIVQAYVDIYRNDNSEYPFESVECDENGYYEVYLPRGYQDNGKYCEYRYTVVARNDSSDYYQPDDEDYPAGIKYSVKNIILNANEKTKCNPEMILRYGLLDYNILKNKSDGSGYEDAAFHAQLSIFDHSPKEDDEPFDFIPSQSETNYRVPTFGELTKEYWLQAHESITYSEPIKITITRGKHTKSEPKIIFDYSDDHGTGSNGNNVGGLDWLN